MTYTPIAPGTPNWDVPVNAAFTDLDTRVTTNTANVATNTTNIASVTSTANAAMVKDSVVINVKDHGAVGDGVHDDTAAINNAMTFIPSGGILLFPPGSYLLNGSSGINGSVAGLVIKGSGAENTKILIGSSFTGTSAIALTAYNTQVRDLSVSGASGTTTSNPVANGIEFTALRRAKVLFCSFFNINGWAIEGVSTSASGTSNFFGSLIHGNYMNSCAGGIHTLGNTTQGFAVNIQISDNQMYGTGVTSGASANLDAIRIEDSWDTLISNNIAWTSVGTGASLHYVGSCAAGFVQNFDGLGPNTGNCVLLEDGANGSPQNVRINGGVIQQGLIGLNITGAAFNIHISDVRFINNQTHGMQVAGTGSPIHLNNVTFQSSGQGATGTNYDLNWSGSSTGYVQGCRFQSAIVAVNSAGVQFSVNIAAAQDVPLLNVKFTGTGQAVANHYTNTPSTVMDITAGSLKLYTQLLSIASSLGFQPSATGNTVISSNLNGSQASNNFVILGDGTIQYGPGGAGPRDAFWSRLAVGILGSTNAHIAADGAGKGFQVKEGSNCKQGTATLVGGSAVVSNTSVTATSRIFLTSNADGGTPGWLRVSARTAGTSFTITSSSGTDTSTVAYEIFEPAP